MRQSQPDTAAFWKQIYDMVLACGTENNPKSFAIRVLVQLRELFRFDEALVYFLDANGRVQDQYLLDVKESCSDIYLKYYANIENKQFSFQGVHPRFHPSPRDQQLLRLRIL